MTPLGLMRRIRRSGAAALAGPRAIWIAVAAGILLALSSVANGLVLDDLYHRLVVVDGVGYLGQPRPFWALFDFFPDDPAVRQAAREHGIWPWWMGNVAVSFFRPVSSVTHAVDHTLWPDLPWLMHLHSLAWYGALIGIAGVTYRRLIGDGGGGGLAVGLATLLYAVDASHGIIVGWLATRNMIVASGLGLAALHAHDRHRRPTPGGSRVAGWLSPIALLAALCSAEVAVGVMGYLIAHAIFLDPARGWRRALAVGPHVGVVIAWKIAYRVLGHGARGTGLYLHPFDEPLTFAAKVTERWPILVGSKLTLPVADVAPVLAEHTQTAVAITMMVVVLGVGGFLFADLLRDDPRARALAVGSLMAAVPSCTTLPNTRMVILVGFGFFGLVGLLVERHRQRRPSRGRRLVTSALVGRHLFLAAAMLPLTAAAPQVFGEVFERADTSLPVDPELRGQTLVVVNVPHPFLASYVPVVRQAKGLPAPARLRTLGSTMDGLRVTRRDAQTIVLQAPGGFLGEASYQLLWDPRDRRDAGYRVRLEDVTIEVEEATPDGRPTVVAFRFHHLPTAESYRWMTWSVDRYVPFELPEQGETITLPALDLESLVVGAPT